MRYVFFTMALLLILVTPLQAENVNNRNINIWVHITNIQGCYDLIIEKKTFPEIKHGAITDDLDAIVNRGDWSVHAKYDVTIPVDKDFFFVVRVIGRNFHGKTISKSDWQAVKIRQNEVEQDIYVKLIEKDLAL